MIELTCAINARRGLRRRASHYWSRARQAFSDRAIGRSRGEYRIRLGSFGYATFAPRCRGSEDERPVAQDPIQSFRRLRTYSPGVGPFELSGVVVRSLGVPWV